MKNKIIIVSLLVAIITVIGISIAYFTNSTNIENLFETKPYGTKVDEEFESPDNWLPGTTTPKTLTVTNTGEVDEAVRISFNETWTSKNAKNNEEEGDLALQQGDNKVALINFINPDDWTKVVENNKTYYYYNYKLGPNEETSELLDSVTFNKAVTNDYNCVESDTDTSKTMKCKSTGNGYDGATYKLTFNIETVQYDKYKTAWGTSVEIADAKLEPEEPEIEGVNGVEFLLENALNQSNATYSDQTKNKMFVFNHEATAQTPALTDYRYIGDSPNNYVYFNCDDLNNQSVSTCEVWRIIGVFDVDDGYGNYEQRIKLVRGNLIINDRWNSVYDEGGYNDWTAANGSLKVFLNGSYFNGTSTNGLKEFARNMIENSKFYLGAFDLSSSLTAEKLYSYERGNVLCKTCRGNTSKLTWTGKIALMYPSDMYMTYKGVNDACYNAPAKSINCNKANASTGWVYKSNKFVTVTNSPYFTWFLSPNSNSVYTVFHSFDDGYLTISNADLSGGVRPVLYLKPSIKIIDGTGEESNPYKLSN